MSSFCVSFSNVVFVCSLEIRELEAKLKSAYLNRARAAQIAEKEATRYEAMVSVNFFIVNYTRGPVKSEGPSRDV